MNALTSIRSQPCDPKASELYSSEFCTSEFLRAITAERDALSHFLALPPAPNLGKILSLLAHQSQPLVFTGIGKSGHVAAKAAATFSSLGVRAVFMNAAEAAHGDLGIVQPASCVILLSNSGSTEELLRIVPSLKARDCNLIAIIGHAATPLARLCDHIIEAPVMGEADPLGLAPTASTTLQLAICDALAVAISQGRGFSKKGFLQNHPAGLLGRQAIRVQSVMRQGDDVPKVGPYAPLLALLTEMSSKRMGAACVVSEDDTLLGLVVDGDVRRALQQGENMAAATAQAVMHKAPLTVSENATIGDVLNMRKARGAPWLVMPVTDPSGRLCGMLHSQDIVG